MNHKTNICVDQISFSYEKGTKILDHVSFFAKEHESIGLIGANGVGKSTLMKLLVGLNLNFEGSIAVNDIVLEKNTLQEIRSKIGYVFQDSDSQLFMSNVYDDVSFGPANYGWSKDKVEEAVSNALELTGITHLKEKQIYKLSGGEKKLVSIATILAMNPDIIIMDEPSIALDPKNRRNLIHILNSLDQIKIIASHDLDMILDTCERTIVMADGKILKDGPAKEILNDQKLLESANLELPLCLQMHNNDKFF